MAINILQAFDTEPLPLNFLWPTFLSRTVGALVAQGATGKSIFALQAAMAVACQVDGGDLLGLCPDGNGAVIYLAGEDPESAIIQRLHAMGKHLNQEARESIAENLTIESTIGKFLDIDGQGGGQGSYIFSNKCEKTLPQYCEGARLVIIDTLTRIHNFNENDNGAMSHLISLLESLTVSTGTTILFLHHVSKASTREDERDSQTAARGASAIVDNVRWCGQLTRMNTAEASKFQIGETDRSRFVRFKVSKQNYSMSPEDRWYKRHEGGVLLPTDFKNEANTQGKGWNNETRV